MYMEPVCEEIKEDMKNIEADSKKIDCYANGENIYLYSSAKYDRPRIFILQIVIIYLNGL